MSIAATRRHLWLVPLLLGLPALVAYYALPEAVENVAYEAFGAMAALAVTAAVALHRPANSRLWLVVAGGFALWTFADAVTAWTTPDGGNVPVPSGADVAYLTGYGCLILGVGLLAGPILRGSQLGRPALIDAGIIATTAAFPIWLLAIDPVLHSASSSLLEATVAAAYPVLDIVLIAVIARHLLLEGNRPHAATLLVAALSVYLLADLVYLRETILDTYSASDPVNSGWLLGYVLAAAAALHPSMARIGPRDEELRPLSIVRRALLLSAAIVPAAVIWFNQSNDDSNRLVLSVMAALLVGLVVVRLFGVLRDQQELRARVQHEAHHDPLTGLANRTLFIERLALYRAHCKGVGLVYLDLNDFKHVNDTMGHNAGDEVLKEVARRLRTTVRASDDVARLGGDEFAVLVSDASREEDVMRAGERISESLTIGPADVHGVPVKLRASIGTSWAASSDATSDELLRNADREMYVAKRAFRLGRSVATG